MREGNGIRYIQRAPIDPEAAAALERAGYARLIAQLLAARGVKDAAQAHVFLSPQAQPLPDPFSLPDMHAAALRLRKALDGGERIVVYGDYDADGITATAALVRSLRRAGGDVSYYIPGRGAEGYGLNADAVLRLAREHTLMVTVDCGVTALAEADIARDAGMDLIVTDHHERLSVLPRCAACVTPAEGGAPLAGVGVAGALIRALLGEAAYERIEDLVAIGTVADIVPLVGANRTLVSRGLHAINSARRRPGVSALLEAAGAAGKRVDEQCVAFVIAPRLNAAGRMGDAARGVELLLKERMEDALPLASDLHEANTARQHEERCIFEEAAALAEAQREGGRAVVAAGEGWNPGVVGISAARLTERYARPAFVFAVKDGVCTGSARSVPGVHLFNVINGMADLFVRYGGHEMAAGVTMEMRNMERFRARLEEALAPMDAELFTPAAYYDAALNIGDATLGMCDRIAGLAPMGHGNPLPVFLVRGAAVLGAQRMGEAHLRMRLAQGDAAADAVAFRQGDRLEEMRGSIDALVQLERNEWNGRASPRLIVRAFERASGG